MKQILILKNGEAPSDLRPFYGNFEDHFIRAMGLTQHDVQIIDMQKEPAMPGWERFAGIIVTGSLSMVTEKRQWMEAEAAWLREAISSEIPTLGICFGHQLLAQALGGVIGPNPHGPEMGTTFIHLTPRAHDDYLFMGMPSPLAVQESHYQSVLALPPHSVLLAGNEHDPNQAFRFGDCTWGMQFHPEYEMGLMRMIIGANKESLLENGQDPASLLNICRETPQASNLIKRFAQLIKAEKQV